MADPVVEIIARDVKELTDGTVNGTGSFDMLMKAIAAHLDLQFKLQRITATDYASVYSELVSVAMQSATSYTLQVKQTAAQEALYKAQTLKTLWEVRDVIERIELTKKQALLTAEEINLRAAQRALTNADTEVKVVEKALRLVDVTLRTSQVALTDAQILDTEADTELKVAEKAIKLIEATLRTAQVALTTAQTANTEADTLIKTANLDLIEAETNLKVTEKTARETETELVAQKKITEQAQTQATALPGSYVGTQVALMTKQKEGFDRDAEQKAVAMLMDVLKIQISTDNITGDIAGAGITFNSMYNGLKKLFDNTGMINSIVKT